MATGDRVKQEAVCPSCGHCQSCGRGPTVQPVPYVPVYPWRPYPYTPYIWSQSQSGNSTSTVQITSALNSAPVLEAINAS